MKKLISIILLSLWSAVFVWAAPGEKNFTIRGEIAGMEDGATVTLAVEGTRDIPRGWISSQLTNGKFELKASTDSPRYCALLLKEKSGKSISCEVIVYDENITIKGNVVKDEEGECQWQSLAIENSDLNKQFREKIAFRMENREKLEEAEERYVRTMIPFNEQRLEALRNGKQDMEQAPEAKRAMQIVEEARKNYHETMERETEKAVSENLDSFWGPLLMSLNYGDAFSFERREAWRNMYNQFSDEVKATFYGRKMKEALFPELVQKDLFPDFMAENRDGEDVSSQRLREGKKCVIVDFWASYCAPCREAIPELKRLYAAYADKGLEIISVSTDLNRDAWLKALDEERMPWPNLHDTRSVFSEKFSGLTLPLVILVDADGKMVGRDMEHEALQAKVKELLNL